MKFYDNVFDAVLWPMLAYGAKTNLNVFFWHLCLCSKILNIKGGIRYSGVNLLKINGYYILADIFFNCEPKKSIEVPKICNYYFCLSRQSCKRADEFRPEPED